MDYQDFIKELGQYLDEAREMLGKGTGETQEFRIWRHNVTDLIDRIENIGYTINCRVKHRRFNVRDEWAPSPTRELQVFNQALQDTIIELETIQRNFNNYGAPVLEVEKSDRPQELKWPEKITLYWLFKHSPLSLWVSLIGIIVVTFSFGVALGQSQLFTEIATKYETKTQLNKPNKADPSKPTP